jgi:hypothetical protein
MDAQRTEKQTATDALIKDIAKEIAIVTARAIRTTIIGAFTIGVLVGTLLTVVLR